jgi:hemerythrin
MKDLEWSDEYLLGIPELDLQHRRIFEGFVNLAEEGLTAHDRWLADSSIVQLVGQLQQHFALEESLMQIIGYPGLEEHIEEHRLFSAEIHDLAQKSLRTKGSVSHQLISSVLKWQREHIVTSDRRYAEYFSRLEIKRAGDEIEVRSSAQAQHRVNC